jgi:hypothetical protein
MADIEVPVLIVGGSLVGMSTAASVRDVSPSKRVFITQSVLDPLFQQRAEELGADLHFATDMISFEQDADGSPL